MNKFLEKIAELAYQYGVAGAGMASYRGSYEMPVPQELIDAEVESSSLS